MRTLLIGTILSLSLVTVSGRAQTIGDLRKMPVEQKARLIMDSLKRILVLTNDQYAKVYPLIVSAANKAKPIWESDDSRRSKREQLRRILEAVEGDLQKILTASQFTLYQDRKAKLIAYYRSHWQSQVILFTPPDID